MVTSIVGSTNKPVASKRLVDYFNTREDLSGILYVGYPIIGTSEGAYPIDAIWISREKGLVVFCLVEGKDTIGYENEQDDSCNKIDARLRSHKELMSKRELTVSIFAITFAPAVNLVNQNDDYILCNEESLDSAIDSIKPWQNSENYETLVSVIQSVSMIRKSRKKRKVINPESRGAKLQKIEDSIANLDSMQGRAVIESVEGVQRIRGLAGSGKTIVLALKAAYLHTLHPEWKIAVTFNTRSLKEQLKRWITSFYAEQTYSEPDWENLKILHAWGSRSTQGGIYYDFCLSHGVEWLDLTQAKDQASNTAPFAMACKKALEETSNYIEEYDAILVDEAQDLPVDFLKMCYEILTPPKRLVYAYDELQSLNLQSLPSPEEIFGLDENGLPRVTFSYDNDGKSNQDIILEKCYRNSRQALTIAHALGFGIYREPGHFADTGIVQMFDRCSLWEDIGYKVMDGQLRDGQQVVLQRTSESSPTFLERHSDPDDLFLCRVFASRDEQDEWVAKEIVKNIKEEELNADDIIVINPDPRTTRERVGRIRRFLLENGIDSHLAGVDCSPDLFFNSDKQSVTFTGIYRAKGNEAAMVYIINSNDCYGDDSLSNVAIPRNRLFTAITRSKAWVRLIGVGRCMEAIKKEVDEVKNHKYQLAFIYPTAEQRKRMNILNRDMSEKEKINVNKKRQLVTELMDQLDSGDIYLEDFDDETIARMKKLFDTGEKS